MSTCYTPLGGAGEAALGMLGRLRGRGGALYEGGYA